MEETCDAFYERLASAHATTLKDASGAHEYLPVQETFAVVFIAVVTGHMVPTYSTAVSVCTQPLHATYIHVCTLVCEKQKYIYVYLLLCIIYCS